MGADVDYTIAVANYNMGDTLERSLRSILDQVGDEFELLVVDDGSDDGSISVLDTLEEEYESLRSIRLESNRCRELGQTRNVSVKNAHGEHVILHLDADDVFPAGVIEDLVTVYSAIRCANPEIALTAAGATVAPREFLLDRGPYRNLPVGGEDLDLWRRLLSEDELIWIRSEDMAKEVSDGKGTTDKMSRWHVVAMSDFQTGVSFPSYYRWAWENHSLIGFGYFAIMLPVAYLRALTKESYRCPPEFRQKGSRHNYLEQQKMWLWEAEEEFGVSIKRDELSVKGKELFHI